MPQVLLGTARVAEMSEPWFLSAEPAVEGASHPARENSIEGTWDSGFGWACKDIMRAQGS